MQLVCATPLPSEEGTTKLDFRTFITRDTKQKVYRFVGGMTLEKPSN